MGAYVFEYSEDFNAEIFDLVTLENGLADAVHSGLDLADRKERKRGGETREYPQKQVNKEET